MYVRATERTESGDNTRYYKAKNADEMIIFLHAEYRGKKYSYSELTKPMAEVVKKLGYKFEKVERTNETI